MRKLFLKYPLTTIKMKKKRKVMMIVIMMMMRRKTNIRKALTRQRKWNKYRSQWRQK